jgi:hypothetical protein
MPKLNYEYDSKEAIPEAHQDLYTEVDGGKWRITEVAGIKTQADVDAVLEGKRKEVNDHKETKTKLAAYRALGDDPEAIRGDLDKIEEYKLAAEGKFDEGQVNELVEKRIAAKMNTLETKFGREKKELEEKLGEATGELNVLKEAQVARTIDDALMNGFSGFEQGKLREGVLSDVVKLARGDFVLNEEGEPVTKDKGLPVSLYIADHFDNKAWAWEGSRGGGGKGGDGGGGGKNPWAVDSWDFDAQAAYIQKHGVAKANELAALVGSKVGARKPKS